MQLRETLPYDVRHAVAALASDGELRHKFRRFTLNPRVEGRARSVLAFAKDLGFEVRELRLPHGVNGRLVTDAFSENGYAIEVNQTLSVEAKRFAVLHEIGHYFRHKDTAEAGLDFDFTFFDLSEGSFYVDESKEREANEFAEALLFGDGQLCAAVTLVGDRVEVLARYFGVTQNVVRIAVNKRKVK